MDCEGPGREAHIVSVLWSSSLQRWVSETYDGLTYWTGETPWEAALAQIIDRGEEGPYEVIVCGPNGQADVFDPSARRG